MKRMIGVQKVINYIGKNFGLVVVLVFTFISINQLIHTGLFPTHDGEYHIIRFIEFDRALRDGNWYPVWAGKLNYTFGSPLFNYVYPLPNYMTSLFHFFGASFIDSFKINFIVASFVGAISAYLYGLQRFGKWGGVFTSVFYTYAPYHFLDIYIRGSVGETWALALFPLSLYLIDRISKKISIRTILLSAVVYSLVIFSHNILAVMYTVFAASYSLILIHESKNKKKVAISFLLTFIVGLLLSAVFFLPALFEQKYVVGLKVFDPLQNFAEVYQLIIPSWGSGFSGISSATQMSFQIGIANILVIATVIFLLIFRKIKKANYFFVLFFLFWILILCYLMTSSSLEVWKAIPMLGYFQFPWRFLSIIILSAAILAGSLTVIFKSRVFLTVISTVCIMSTIWYAKPAYFLERGDDYYSTNATFIYGTNSIGNVFQTKWLGQQKKLPEKDKNIKLTSESSTKRMYEIDLKDSKMVVFPITYFPGWKGYLNSTEIEIINKEGKIGINVPTGRSEVEFIFEDTPIRIIAKTTSLLTLTVILLILFRPTVLQYFYARRN